MVVVVGATVVEATDSDATDARVVSDGVSGVD